MRVEFYRHGLGEEEKAALAAVLESLFLTSGPKTAAAEAELAAFLGRRHVITVASGTAALHLALAALGVGPGDEVIVPAITFAATANPIVWLKARPVLADVSPLTGLLDLDSVASLFTPRTRAVIPVHLYGTPVDMLRLATLCKARKVALVEDAAHCFEGLRDEYRPGEHGDVACFSFYATKNVTTGEGGALATDDDDLATRLRRLRLHGLTRTAADQHEGYAHVDVMEPGYKYNMGDLQAALLPSQLARVEACLAAREALCHAYDQAFVGQPHVHPVTVPPGCRSARHLYPIRVPAADRDRLLAFLQRREIGFGVHYRALHRLSFYRDLLHLPPDALPHATRFGDEVLSLPLYPSLSTSEQEAVVRAVTDFFQESGGDPDVWPAS